MIRQCREVTARGVTHVRELYAQGYINQDGKFRLERCVGRYVHKTASRKVEPVAANRAA